MFGRGEAERSLSPSREFPLQLQLISAPWIKGWSTEGAARIAELRYIDPFTVLIISGHSGCRGMTFRDSELTIESVMRRLLRGGQLVHSQNGSVCNTPFQALTLYHVGALVQHHIVGEQESVQRQQRLAAGNVIQMPEMQARISEEALMGRGQSSKGRTFKRPAPPPPSTPRQPSQATRGNDHYSRQSQAQPSRYSGGRDGQSYARPSYHNDKSSYGQKRSYDSGNSS